MVKSVRFLFIAAFAATIVFTTVRAFADGKTASTDLQNAPKNSPNQINFNVSGDNQHDSTTHVGGDIYFKSNDQLGIYAEHADISSPIAGRATIKTFDVSLSTDWRKPFSYGAEYTYMGSAGVLAQNTLHFPLAFHTSDNWLFSVTPGIGSIDISNDKNQFNFPINSADNHIIDGSVGGSVDYYGFNNWDLQFALGFRFYNRNPSNLWPIFNPFAASRDFNVVSLDDQIIKNYQSISLIHFFNRFDLGGEFISTQSALDNNNTNTLTVFTEIYWTKKLSSPISISSASTSHVAWGPTIPPSMPPPSDVRSLSLGLSYAFE